MKSTFPKPKKIRPSEVYIAEITPDLAAAWLEDYNNCNRKLNPDDIARYASDMEHGRWDDTRDPLKFDTDDQIVDGQDRLAAVVRYGKPVEFHITFGLRPQTRLRVDDGRKRRFYDDLKMNGITNGSQIEALMRKVRTWNLLQGLTVTGGVSRVSRTVLAEDYEEIHEQVKAAMVLANEYPRVPTGMGSKQFMCYLLAQHAPIEVVQRFFRVLSIGSQAEEDQPLVELRSKLERNRTEVKLGIHRSFTAIEVYFMILGWNAWLTGKKVKSYNLPIAGLKPPFPMPTQVEAK